MSETLKKENKRDKKETVEEVKKPERIVQAKYVEYSRGPVVFDNIRKEINRCERKLERSWSKKYEYLAGEYFEKILAEESAKAGIPVDTFVKKSPENLSEKSPLALYPSRMPMPMTSSGFVGWRSSRPEHSLEFVGPFHVSAKHTIDPPLISGEFRVMKQKFIYLG